MSSYNKTASSSTPLYRAYQFFIALRAYLPGWAGGLRGDLPAADARLVTTILPAPAQQRLFERMSPNDRRHGIAVARTLQQAGHHQPALLQAALLHDVAKCLGQPLPHRVLIVLLEAFWPAGLARLSARSFQDDDLDHIAGWRRPFVVHAHHPALGAAWAAEAECHPVAVRLIARHQDGLDDEDSTEEARLLAALQRADNLN